MQFGLYTLYTLKPLGGDMSQRVSSRLFLLVNFMIFKPLEVNAKAHVEEARFRTMKTMMITPEGLEKLKAELDHLWRVERPDTTQKVNWAASLGDRSENADYHYNKKRLRELDKRILYLRKCIDDLKVINYSPFQEGKVMFGAWVEIENEKRLKKRLRIVGGEELIGATDYISMDSPMAQALLKKEVGDEVIVKTATAQFVWKIINIEYQK
jgi:transcription elongation factor GreB